ncbi:helix-turn-helix domain-containing protein [Psychrobium sp. nBUS_13]|uniref:helix-turn-helix domain-containing protein n=1 Tax=Psychrobium sp. nBUS_13 TaxID=3395319 RepID=UPI003EBC9C9A
MKLDGKKVSALRLARCWSQEQLAEAAGLSVRTIQRIEKGGSGSLETMKSLSAVFQEESLGADEIIDGPVSASLFDMLKRFSWAIAFLITVLLVGAWVIDILIPTLKGADFNQQYEIHNNFRYLDFAVVSFLIGVIILSVRLLQPVIKLKRMPFSTSK